MELELNKTRKKALFRVGIAISVVKKLILIPIIISACTRAHPGSQKFVDSVGPVHPQPAQAGKAETNGPLSIEGVWHSGPAVGPTHDGKPLEQSALSLKDGKFQLTMLGCTDSTCAHLEQIVESSGLYHLPNGVKPGDAVQDMDLETQSISITPFDEFSVHSMKRNVDCHDLEWRVGQPTDATLCSRSRLFKKGMLYLAFQLSSADHLSLTQPTSIPMIQELTPDASIVRNLDGATPDSRVRDLQTAASLSRQGADPAELRKKATPRQDLLLGAAPGDPVHELDGRWKGVKTGFPEVRLFSARKELSVISRIEVTNLAGKHAACNIGRVSSQLRIATLPSLDSDRTGPRFNLSHRIDRYELGNPDARNAVCQEKLAKLISGLDLGYTAYERNQIQLTGENEIRFAGETLKRVGN